MHSRYVCSSTEETAKETETSPEKPEPGFPITVSETSPSEKIDLDMRKSASLEQPEDRAPEIPPDPTPAQTSSPCGSGTDVKEPELAAEGVDTGGTGILTDLFE